jgi:hypothetical protein
MYVCSYTIKLPPYFRSQPAFAPEAEHALPDDGCKRPDEGDVETQLRGYEEVENIVRPAYVNDHIIDADSNNLIPEGASVADINPTPPSSVYVGDSISMFASDINVPTYTSDGESDSCYTAAAYQYPQAGYWIWCPSPPPYFVCMNCHTNFGFYYVPHPIPTSEWQEFSYGAVLSVTVTCILRFLYAVNVRTKIASFDNLILQTQDQTDHRRNHMYATCCRRLKFPSTLHLHIPPFFVPLFPTLLKCYRCIISMVWFGFSEGEGRSNCG